MRGGERGRHEGREKRDEGVDGRGGEGGARGIYVVKRSPGIRTKMRTERGRRREIAIADEGMAA
jgi:hypothetical protein